MHSGRGHVRGGDSHVPPQGRPLQGRSGGGGAAAGHRDRSHRDPFEHDEDGETPQDLQLGHGRQSGGPGT